MIDYTKLKAAELRKLLIESGCNPNEIAQLKGKTQLVQAHKMITSQLSLMDEPEEEDDDEIMYGDPKWHDAVMTHFTPDELDQAGHPKINGLRRVTSVIIGPIISSGVKRLFPATEEGPGRASAIVEVAVAWMHNREDIRVFSSCAGAWLGNTDDEFAVFPEAMAETRAEARALRKILGLNTVTADETTTKDTAEVVEQYVDKTVTGEYGQDGPISDYQKAMINTLCSRLNIDIAKFINSGNETYNSINDVNRLQAANMIKHLNKYQTDKIEIPGEIKL